MRASDWRDKARFLYQLGQARATAQSIAEDMPSDFCSRSATEPDPSFR